MTAYNRYLGGSSSKHVAAPSKQRGYSILEAIIDFNETGNTNAATDTFNVLKLPAGYALIATEIELLRADTAGNSGTVMAQLGTTDRGTTQAPVAASTDGSAVPGFLTNAASGTYIGPASTDRDINILVSTGAVNALVRVVAVVAPMVTAPAPVITGSGTFTKLADTISFVSKAP